MGGMIAVVSADTSKYTMFWVSLDALERPMETTPCWPISTDRIHGRNTAVQQALEAKADWLFFVDDDHVFGPKLLRRMLGRGVPVVGALYLQRHVPFLPVAFSHKEGNIYVNVNLHNHGDDDLIKVAAVGTGGMLIQRKLLEQMEPPWFEHGDTTEDLLFCNKVYELGLGPVYCDLGARMGHLQPAAVWPAHDGTNWQAGFALADGFSVTVELPEPVTTA